MKTLLAGLLLAVSIAAHAEYSATDFNAAWSDYNESLDAGDAATVVTTSRTVLEIARELLPESDERIPILMLNHATALDRADEVSEARRFFDEATSLAKRIHGADSIAYADFAFETGASLVDVRSTGMGRKYLQEAEAIYRGAGAEQRLRLGLAAMYLGQADMTSGKFDAAEQHLLEAAQYLPLADEETLADGIRVRALLVQNYELNDKSELATPHCLAIGAANALQQGPDYLPLFRMAPHYPSVMLNSGQEGYVIFSFTVDEEGYVRDPEVIEESDFRYMSGRQTGSSMSVPARERSFRIAAEEAVEGFRYAPRFENGKPVATEGVKTRITFELED